MSGMKIAQGNAVAVVRGTAEGEIRDRHGTQPTNVDIGKCWMRLEMLYQSVDAVQRHLTLVERRRWVSRRRRVVAPSHGSRDDCPAD